MSSGEATAWIRRRNRFNHDWLRNVYLLHLGHYLNILDDLIEDREFESHFTGKLLSEWLARRQEALDLVADFVRDMSPSRLFNETPLSKLFF